MDIRGMHYDVKYKLNKIDSQQYRNLKVPELDWILNEAIEIFIKSIAQPRKNGTLGFEVNQRAIDDIRTVVIDSEPLTPLIDTDGSYYVELPNDYMFYVSSKVAVSKAPCASKDARGMLTQHDDRKEDSPFDDSSFEWGEVNIRFYDKGIKIFTDGTFTVDQLKLDYIRKHVYVHNAQDYLLTQTYNLPDGTVLTGSQNCELPEHTHREIVDIAVLILTGNLQIPDYQVKQAKINLNN